MPRSPMLLALLLLCSCGVQETTGLWDWFVQTFFLCGPVRPFLCPRQNYELKTIHVDELLSEDGLYYRSDRGVRVADSSSLPPQLQGVFWLAFNGGPSLMTSFARSNDGGGVSTGRLERKRHWWWGSEAEYRVSTIGDRTWSVWGDGSILGLAVAAANVYIFRFDSFENPTYARIFPQVTNFFGLTVPPSILADIDMTLLSDEQAAEAGYPGSVVWDRKGTFLFTDRPYNLTQIADGEGKILRPAYDRFVEFVNRESAGILHYFEIPERHVDTGV